MFRGDVQHMHRTSGARGRLTFELSAAASCASRWLRDPFAARAVHVFAALPAPFSARAQSLSFFIFVVFFPAWLAVAVAAGVRRHMTVVELSLAKLANVTTGNAAERMAKHRMTKRFAMAP